MRREDNEKLQQPYSTATPINDRFADALGVKLPAVRELYEEVFGDLDETAYGVGWWAPNPGTSRRVLISDQSRSPQPKKAMLKTALKGLKEFIHGAAELAVPLADLARVIGPLVGS
jgi:hypothetical protein